MILNLAIAAPVIFVTVLVHTFGLIAVAFVMNWLIERFGLRGHGDKVMSISFVVLGLFLLLSIEVWIWAGVYLALGAFPDVEHALYFSLVAFSTVGFGDIVPEDEWRLLGGVEALNGFLMIGWSTAYLIAASTRFGPFRPGEHF
jgi:Ion channel